MYTFCLIVISLALFLTAFNSQSIEVKSQKTIKLADVFAWFSSNLTEVQLWLFSKYSWKATNLEDKINIQKKGDTKSLSTSKPKLEKTLTHTSIA